MRAQEGRSAARFAQFTYVLALQGFSCFLQVEHVIFFSLTSQEVFIQTLKPLSMKVVYNALMEHLCRRTRRLGGEPEIVGPVHKVVQLSCSGVFSDFQGQKSTTQHKGCSNLTNLLCNQLWQVLARLWGVLPAFSLCPNALMSSYIIPCGSLSVLPTHMTT